MLKLIKDELNVKEVIFDDKIQTEVELDTEISPELQEEGRPARSDSRSSGFEKKSGLNQAIKLFCLFRRKFKPENLWKNSPEKSKKSAGVERLEFKTVVEDGQEISTDGFVVKVKIEV